ncbi:MAG: hypothetical protein OZ948_05410 [Deltaproteobacteria bacterium]|nr:hypothetical protein [Deltaproteobacteria bacterium]
MNLRTRCWGEAGSLLRVPLLLVLAWPLAASAQPASFQALEQAVIDAGNGTRPDIAVAACQTDPEDALACLEGNSPITGSGWDINEACFTLDQDGVLSVGFLQGGRAGDGDGDGDPNAGTFQFDKAGIGEREGYAVEIDTNVPPDGLADFRLAVTQTNVGGFALSGLAGSEGGLCAGPLLVGDPVRVEPCDVLAGALVGSFAAGTRGVALPGPGSVSREILLEVATADLPRPFDVDRFVLRLQSGSQDDTCLEDQTIFTVARAGISLEKQARGTCQPPAPGSFVFSSEYTIVNDGSLEFDSLRLEDAPSSEVPLGTPTCAVTEGEPDSIPTGPLAVTPTGGGGFTASIAGALPPADFRANPASPFPSTGDIDCGLDGILDPSCGRVVVRCEWPGISAEPFEPNESLTFENVAEVFGLEGSTTRASDRAEAGARADKNQCPKPPDDGGGTRKEHEGVGFDDQLSLVPTLPLGNGTQFGSGVFPDGEPDVDSRETFTTQGALEVIGRPGVWSNIPRIPPGKAGVHPQPGLPALFSWRMLVSNLPMQDVMDVSCSLCAERAWRDDHSPAQTFTPRGGVDPGLTSYLVANEPALMEVVHFCGPLHTESPCGGPMDAITTPGLERVPTDMRPYNYMEFLGCKPKTILLEPFGGRQNSLLLPGDLIEVRILVPGSERARVFADVSSCEAAYLTADPLAP